MNPERNPLLAELKEPADVLSKLSPEESVLLLGMLRSAKAKLQTSSDRSLDDVLNGLPRLIRPAARKILFGR
ncbi:MULTISPECIES: hypothetical protein [unclassified Mycobacterium]|uniref:hypothetical protein n=1 Tax=unclassified Mycobacterium TaxID=2642494 RepID=UPI00073FD711|nr:MULTISPECIES: hypothetical protein [unclassified Mycobacterium]KUH82378.1 hypothetical protein AU185_22160 [Mycobacterium sp. GA-0227b]KUH88948.1 hypothetical protein AU186_09045 [Mycobacterium sp. GA-1999]